MDSDNELNNKFKAFLSQSETTLPGFIGSKDYVSDVDDELITTVMDFDEFEKLLKEVSESNSVPANQTEVVLPKEDGWVFPDEKMTETSSYYDLAFKSQILEKDDNYPDRGSEHDSSSEDCSLVDFDPFQPDVTAVPNLGSSLNEDHQRTTHNSETSPSDNTSSSGSPVDDRINRFRYSREDFIVLHCRTSTREACFETFVTSVEFNKPLVPWKCSRHREICSEEKVKSTKNSTGAAAVFDKELNTTAKIIWKPATLLTQPIAQATGTQSYLPNKAPSLENSIWKDSDPSSRTPKSQRRRRSPQNSFDEKAVRDSSPASSGEQSVDSTGDSISLTGLVKKIVINPYISIPVDIIKRDREGFIYVYSTTRVPTINAVHHQYFKVGRQMDIKHSNHRLLSKCPIVKQIRDRFPGADFRHLRRFKVSRPNLLMFFVNHEFSQNYFNTVSPMIEFCNWCGGSHRDWRYLTSKSQSLLEMKHEIPAVPSLPGWTYINAMITQLIEFIDNNDFS